MSGMQFMLHIWFQIEPSHLNAYIRCMLLVLDPNGHTSASYIIICSVIPLVAGSKLSITLIFQKYLSTKPSFCRKCNSECSWFSLLLWELSFQFKQSNSQIVFFSGGHAHEATVFNRQLAELVRKAIQILRSCQLQDASFTEMCHPFLLHGYGSKQSIFNEKPVHA